MSTNAAVRFTCMTRMNVGTSYCSMGVSAPNKRGVVQQAVEPAVALFDGGGHGFVVRRERALEIERHDAGFGRRRAAAISACTASSLRTVRPSRITSAPARRERQRHGAADAGARAGDHDHAAAQFVGGRRMRARIESSRVRSGGSVRGRLARFVGFERSAPASSAHRLFDRVDGSMASVSASGAELGELARLGQSRCVRSSPRRR